MGFTLRQVAALIGDGVSPSTVLRHERGACDVPTSLALRWGEITDGAVTPRDLDMARRMAT